jgi:hypothetical protein
VGRYSPDVNKFRKKSPNTKIGREKRFMELKHCHTLKTEVPHAYLKHDTDSIGKKPNGRAFAQEKRFVVVALKDKDKEFYPAPSHYNSHFHNTIASSMFERGRTGHSLDRNNLSKEKFNSKQYYKELERGYLNNHSPGPGAYNHHEKTKSLSYVRKSIDSSFTKVSHFR